MTHRPAATYLHGTRLTWSAAPPQVREWVAERVGGEVVGWHDRVGGMSTGLATVVRGNRRAVFVKALDATVNPDGERFYAREAEFAELLPVLPAVPRILDHGVVVADDHRWIVIVYPAVTGEPPPHPWRFADLVRVLDAWLPVQCALSEVQGWPRRGVAGSQFSGWRTLADQPGDPWHEIASDWAGREERFEASFSDPEGSMIGAHIDLRADNVLLSRTGTWFVDWAHLDTAPSWFDPLILLCDVIASGGDHDDGGEIDVLEVWSTHPACHATPPEVLITGVAAFAAFMHVGSLKPAHPAVPHGRGWKRLVAERTLPFALRHR